MMFRRGDGETQRRLRLSGNRCPEQQRDTLEAEGVQALDLLAFLSANVRVSAPETDSSPCTLRLAVRCGFMQALNSVLRQSARVRETVKGQQSGKAQLRASS